MGRTGEWDRCKLHLPFSVTGGAVISAPICSVSLKSRESLEGEVMRVRTSVFELYIFVWSRRS